MTINKNSNSEEGGLRSRLFMNFTLWHVLSLTYIQVVSSFHATSSEIKVLSPLSSSRHQYQQYVPFTQLSLSSNNDGNMNNDAKEPPLTAFLDKVSKTGLDNTRIQKNALVIAKYDLPDLGIFADQAYELQEVYTQINLGNGLVQKEILPELDLKSSDGTRYIKLFSPLYHDKEKFGGKAVTCTPEEVGLVSMKDEVLDSIVFALPVLSFWVGTCVLFSYWYNAKYGGTFIDALMST